MLFGRVEGKTVPVVTGDDGAFKNANTSTEKFGDLGDVANGANATQCEFGALTVGLSNSLGR